MNLATKITMIKGVGEKTAKQFEKAGIFTVKDLIYFLPYRHEDFTNLSKISDLKPGKITVKARCEKISTRPVRRGLRLTSAVIYDDTGKINVVWFNQP